MLNTKVLITGASGYIGSNLLKHLQENNYNILGCARNNTLNLSNIIKSPELSTNADWKNILQDIDVVVHLAGLAHNLSSKKAYSLEDFREVNVRGTINLANQALQAAVKRFIFISSIGVNGASTQLNNPYTEESTPAPHAPYAQSKLEAEQALSSLTQGSTMELVIIRPPLVYSGAAPGNFQRLLKLIYTGLPLPFGIIRNQRSMIEVSNLTNFIELCIHHPAAANELFLVSDGNSISTSDMIKHLSAGMNKNNLLLPIPDFIMKISSILAGKKAMYQQLCGSLTIDISKAKKILNWHPNSNVSQLLYIAGNEFQLSKNIDNKII